VTQRHSSSASRRTAGAAGFLILTHCFDRPERHPLISLFLIHVAAIFEGNPDARTAAFRNRPLYRSCFIRGGQDVVEGDRLVNGRFSLRLGVYAALDETSCGPIFDVRIRQRLAQIGAALSSGAVDFER